MTRPIILAPLIVVATLTTVALGQQSDSRAPQSEQPVRRTKTQARRDAKTRKPPASKSRKNTETSAENAIRQAVTSYVKAFNANSAKAVAEHWATNGVYVDRETGEKTRGRAAIQEQFADMFASGTPVRIQVSIQDIRQLTETVVVHDGTARVLSRGEVSESAYTAIHVRQGKSWKIDSVRENILPSAPVISNNYEHLKQLGWMVGDWVDVADDATVTTNCQWTKNRNFLTRSFKVASKAGIELEGTQVIGWDPVRRRIRSWVFDSDGGFGEGVWSRDGDRWMVKSRQVMADGSTGSSTNVFRYIDNDRFSWKSFAREVNGKFQPNLEETVIVRR